MAKSVEDLFAESVANADRIRAVDVYDQRGGHQQFINTVAKNQAIDNEVAGAQQEFLVSVHDVQKELMSKQNNLRADLYDKRAAVTKTLNESNKPFDALRTQTEAEIQENLERMNALEADRPKFLKNPIANIVNRMRYGALEAETSKDIRRQNVITQAMNQNYNEAARTLSSYVSNDFMRNAQVLSYDAQLQNQKLKLQAQKLDLTAKHMAATEQRAAKIMNATRNAKADGAVTDEDYSNTSYQFLHTMFGRKNEMTANDIKTYRQILTDMGPEQRSSLVRGQVQFMTLRDGGIVPQATDILELSADKANIREFMSLAQLVPDSDYRQTIQKSSEAWQGEIAASVTNSYAQEVGAKRDEKTQQYKFTPEQQETLQGRISQAVSSEAAVTPAINMFGSRTRQINNQPVIDPSGNDITPQALGTNQQYLEGTVSRYMPVETFRSIVASDEFQTGFTGTTSSSDGAIEKQVFLAEQLISQGDLDERQAYALAAETARQFYTGKAMRDNPDMIILQRFGATPNVDTTLSIPSTGILGFGVEGKTFRLDNASDLLEYRERKSAIERRQRENRQAYQRNPSLLGSILSGDSPAGEN